MDLRHIPAALLVATLLPAAAQSLPEDDAEELVETTCSQCHSPTRIMSKHWNRTEWESTLREMLADQTDVTASDREQILAYLVKFFGRKINVNTATARQTETALSLTSKESAALIAFREQNGPFKTVDDLKKIPGIDTSKIDANKPNLEF